MKKKTMDIYLIAGQSNAGGHTKVKDANALYAKAPGLYKGYRNGFRDLRGEQ